MIIFLLLILFVLFIISLFSSEKFSPIPYFPTNKKDIPAIIKALKLRNDQIIFDLGAGNGIVIFEAAKKAINLNTQFVAIDIIKHTQGQAEPAGRPGWLRAEYALIIRVKFMPEFYRVIIRRMGVIGVGHKKEWFIMRQLKIIGYQR